MGSMHRRKLKKHVPKMSIKTLYDVVRLIACEICVAALYQVNFDTQ